MISRKEITTYMERMLCDKCNTEMEHNDVVLAGFPLQYVHVCPECGNKQIGYGHTYPRLVEEEVQ